jgi:nitric oxide reductase NorE protein
MTPDPLPSAVLAPGDGELRRDDGHDRRGTLPGDLMIWVLIVSELMVFGAGLVAFLAVRLTDPDGFAAAQDHLHRVGAGMNTLILITSGWFAARGAQAAEEGLRNLARRNLLAAAALGVVFLWIKGTEFAGLSALGFSTDTNAFFTFYFLLTGFHAAHVLAGVVLLSGLSLRPTPFATENGVAFWHMVDLVWVILFPVIYMVH